MLWSDNNNYTDVGIPWSESNVNTAQSALYAEEQLKVGSRVTLNAGARFDNITYDRQTSSDSTTSSLTPRFGVSYAPDSRTAWKANWGMYSKFVPADSVETSYFGAAPSDIGEADAQQSTTGEISFERQVSDSVALRITPFFSNFRHLGDFVDIGGGVTQYRTIGRGEARGVEFYARKKMTENWQGWLSYTYQTVKAGDPPGLMDYTTWDQRHSLAVVADYKKGIWGQTLRTDFGSGRQDDSAPAGVARHANPYAMFTYTLSADVSKAGDTVTLSVFNIFNNRQAAQYTYMFGPRTGYSIVPERCVSVGFNRGF